MCWPSPSPSPSPSRHQSNSCLAPVLQFVMNVSFRSTRRRREPPSSPRSCAKGTLQSVQSWCRAALCMAGATARAGALRLTNELLPPRRAIENNPGLQVDKVRTLRRLLTRSHNAASTRDLGRAARTAAARRQRRAAARLHRGHRAVKKPAHVGARRRTESQDGVRESRRGEDDDTDSVRPYHEDDFGEVTRPDNPIVRPVSAPTYATPGRESQATAVSASVASTGDSSVDGTNGSTGQKRVRIALLSRQKSRRGATRPKTAHERLSHTPTETFWLKTTQHEQGQGMPYVTSPPAAGKAPSITSPHVAPLPCRARASDPVQEKVIKNHGQHVTPHTPPREIMKLAEAAQTAGSTVKANVLIPRFSYASCVLKGSRTMQGSSACCDATWAEPEFCGNANFATFGVVDGHGLNVRRSTMPCKPVCLVLTLVSLSLQL